MGTDKANVHDPLPVVDGDDKPVIIAFNIEDHPIVTDEEGEWERTPTTSAMG
jgi:hypothetical protein